MARVVEGTAKGQEPFRAGSEDWYFAVAPASMVRTAIGMAVLDLAPEKKPAAKADPAADIQEQLKPLDFMAALLEACTYTDPDLTTKRFSSVAQVWDDLQMDTMVRAGEAALKVARAGVEARATARSFPDARGDDGGLAPASAGEGVRGPADAAPGAPGG